MVLTEVVAENLSDEEKATLGIKLVNIQFKASEPK
jgi:hypothetical protein